jgi:diguanylate cyclase (GGDEF)-like protein
MDWQNLTEKVEDVAPLAELWEPAVENVLKGTLRPFPLISWIERDVALTTRILSIANSEQYGRPGQVTRVVSALEYLGLDLVQNLILSTVCDQQARQDLYGRRIPFGDFWMHCLACSIFSGLLAEKVVPSLAGEAKMAGLLHDVGKVLLNLQDEEAAGRVHPIKGKKALRLQESEQFGLPHDEAGQQILKRLFFPPVYQSACGRHHRPWEEMDMEEESDALAACVGLADYLTYQLELGQGGNVARSMERPADLSLIGIEQQDLDEIKRLGVHEFEEVRAEIRPGSLPMERQMQLIRKAAQNLGRRSLYLNKNVTELSRLQEIHEDLNRTLELEDLLQHVATRLGTIFSAEALVFVLFPDQGVHLHCFSKLPLSDEFINQMKDLIIKDIPPEYTQEIISEPVVPQLLVPDATGGRFQMQKIRSHYSLHLQGREGPIGRLIFFSGLPNSFSRSEQDFAGIIGGEIALSLDRAHWMRKTELLSITDELTGLYNHRHFVKILNHEVGRSRRYKTSLCLLMIDIDHFKLLNDTYGHQQGDRMLRALAGIFQEATRESDMVARYGGEEFSVVLPSTNLAGGKITAERIRSSVESHSFVHPGNPALSMTVSVGVAHYRGEGIEQPSDLVEQADKALYRAKEQGRNVTIIYGEF